MWSDCYSYYNIQSDEFFSEKIEIKIAVNILLEANFFIQKNHSTFINRDNFPWVEIVLIETKNGNFTTNEKEIKFVNLISIVCTKQKNIEQLIYINTFSKIAQKMKWKLYLEEDDLGNENVALP